jgi:putative flippase GtrA
MADEKAAGASRDASRDLTSARHWGGFIVSGGLAFCVDGGVMELGIRMLGLPPLVARIASVACAMVTAWLAHRRLTFALTTKPSLSEFGRYVAAASATALVNYAVFAFILLGWPSAPAFGALVAASCVATIFSYISMRYGVFRRS